MKYDTISSCAPILSIKNSGFSKGGIYIARYEIIDNNLSEKENAYPKYYHNIQQQPYLFRNSDELKRAGYISQSFGIEYASLNFHDFVDDILSVYAERYDIRNLME